MLDGCLFFSISAYAALKNEHWDPFTQRKLHWPLSQWIRNGYGGAGGKSPSRAPINRLGKKNSIPIDLIFGLMLSYQYDRTRTIITPFQFLTTFPRKIQGVADTAEEADMQPKFTFFLSRLYQPLLLFFFLVKKPMIKRRKSKERAKKPSKAATISKRVPMLRN